MCALSTCFALIVDGVNKSELAVRVAAKCHLNIASQFSSRAFSRLCSSFHYQQVQTFAREFFQLALSSHSLHIHRLITP